MKRREEVLRLNGIVRKVSVANEEYCSGDNIGNVKDVKEFEPHGNDEEKDFDGDKTENDGNRKANGRCTILRKLRKVFLFLVL